MMEIVFLGALIGFGGGVVLGVAATLYANGQWD